MGVVPERDKVADMVRAALPAGLAHHVIRVKNILFLQAFYTLCRKRPKVARRILLKLATKALGDPKVVAEHFTPAYDPWDQRVCALPNADLFRAIRRGKVDVVTDHVERFVPEGIRLQSGTVLPADVVVTATGLKLLAFGGIEPSVDGAPAHLPDLFVWQGAMLTGLPNFAVCVGYTNAAWTLRGDLSSRLVCRVLNEMARRDAVSVVPVPDRALAPRPLIDLTSGYVQRSIDQFPKQGHRGPWRVRQNYLIDSATTLRRDLGRTLRFEKARDPADLTQAG